MSNGLSLTININHATFDYITFVRKRPVLESLVVFSLFLGKLCDWMNKETVEVMDY